MMGQVRVADTAGPAYKSLYKLGSVAAFMVALLTLSEVVVFAVYPPPGTVSGWFELFQSHKFPGLLDFWGLEIPMYIMFAVVFIAFWAVLGKANKGLMAVATVFALLGIGIFLATNNPVSMLSLSHQYVRIWASTIAPKLTAGVGA